MTPHDEEDAISAYLDGELDAAGRRRVEEHLRSCPDCVGRREALERAMGALASLPDVSPTADESRAIRLGVLERMGKAPAAPRPLVARLFPALAAVAVLVVGVVGFALLRPGGGPRDTSTGLQRGAQGDKQLEAAAGDAAPLEFTSDQQVRDVVLVQPEVAHARDRYRVADVGRRQSEAVSSVGGQYPVKTPAAAADSRQAPPAPAGAGEPETAAAQAIAPSRSLEDCLRTTLETQPHPLMPILARPAFYNGEPVYLLVYAWTTSTDGNAALDRLQAWLVTRTDCTPRHYSQFAAP